MATQLRVGSLAHAPEQLQKPGGTEPSPVGSTVGAQAAPAHMHWPPVQVAPSGQCVPQPPQLRMSLSRLTQPSAPQHDCPRLHLSPCGGQPQLPPRQMVPTGQTVPQSPQLRGSCCTSVQVAPQHLPPH